MNTDRPMTRVPRASSSLVSFWAVAGIAVILVGDAAVRGDWSVFALSVAPGALVVWVAWLFLYHPSISFNGQHVVTVNPGRVIDVPWQLVAAVRQRPQLLLELENGTRVMCWGSPFPDKPGLRRQTPGERRREGPAGEVVAVLEGARNSPRDPAPDAAIIRHWDAPALGIGTALAIGCLIELLATR